MASITATDYYQKAKKCLDQRKLINFIENIGSAAALAQDDQGQLGDILFMKVKGLMAFQQHQLALDSVSVALQLNEGAKAFRLKKYQGVSLGYLGYYDQAIQIFKDLLGTTDDPVLLVEAYINLTWVYLTFYGTHGEDSALEEVPIYLDLIYENFDHINNTKKIRYYMNYCSYYVFIGKYEEAIEIQKEAIQYCDEQHLPEVYNNLAAVFLKVDQDGVSEHVNKYTRQVEIIGERYDNFIEMGKAFTIKSLAELRQDQLFTALDTMYLALEHFKKAEAYPWAFECLIKINEVINEYKIDRLKSLKEDLKGKFINTPFYNQI